MGKGLTIAGFSSAAAGLVVGLFSIILSWLALPASLIALALSVTGLVLSSIGGNKLKEEGKSRGLATAGLIVGIIGSAVSSIVSFACGICALTLAELW